MQKTTNYAQFILIDEFHSKPPPGYLEELEQKILADNRLHEYPIDVTEKMEICDGRHRFLVAQKNKLPIYYQVTYDSEAYRKWREANAKAYLGGHVIKIPEE